MSDPTEPSKSKRPYYEIKSKVIALTMLKVLKDTGKINMTEVSRRLKPNLSPDTHNAEAYTMLENGLVMEQFFKLIRVDDASLAKYGPKEVLKSVLADLAKLDHMMENPDIDAEDLAKLASVKTQKQKLLGSYFGLFQDKAPEKEESDPDKLFQSYGDK